MSDIEVVGYRWLDTAHFRAKIPARERAYGPHKVAEWQPLMTVTQHDAMVTAKDEEYNQILEENHILKLEVGQLRQALEIALQRNMNG